MSDTRLRIYLNDHLAFATAEGELIDRCLRNNREGNLGEFLGGLRGEQQLQRKAINDVLLRIGGTANPLKQGIAWLGEKLGRLKLNDELLQYSVLSRLVELETLAVASVQRRMMWENLQNTRADDERFANIDFAAFAAQSAVHAEMLDTHRAESALHALSGDASGA